MTRCAEQRCFISGSFGIEKVAPGNSIFLNVVNRDLGSSYTQAKFNKLGASE